MSRVVCTGEGMLELSREGDGWRLGFGGDTLNTAVHLARLGHEVRFLTAVGSDPMSLRMTRQWSGEGIDLSLVLRHPGRQSGLYAIDTDPAGERSFTYWRDTSAAREMFGLPGAHEALSSCEDADLLYFSLISLAILPPEHRGRLLELASAVRKRGGLVAFDGNYRARLWDDPGAAAAARDEALAHADIGLPTLDDETALTGTGSPAVVADHWRARGCGEVVVKLGEEGCLLPGGMVAAPPARLKPLDTSGAGDAFSAGYLSSRLRGASAADAARRGHELAGWTVMRRGAIPPLDPDAPYGAK